MSFSSVDEVANWARDNGGEEALRAAHAKFTFGDGPRVCACINEWLRQQEEARRLAENQLQAELYGRELAASETSAAAANRSAIAAEKSAYWARWSAFIALIAIVVSLVALVK